VTEDEFWVHIRATRRRDADEHGARLERGLAKLPVGDILDFEHWWHVAEARAYLRDLWGAAYVINGGCSDDGFDYFRWWLILQGRKVFEAALADPDTLAAVVDPDEEVFECECHPAAGAYLAATGREPDEAGYDAFHAAVTSRHPARPQQPDLAPRWDFDDDDEVRKRFPKLAALYLSDGET
jgi:hypothetical protein